jgi:hypothetical protein
MSVECIGRCRQRPLSVAIRGRDAAAKDILKISREPRLSLAALPTEDP